MLKTNITRLRVQNGLQDYPSLHSFPSLRIITIHVGFVPDAAAGSLFNDNRCAELIVRRMFALPQGPGRKETYEWALQMRRDSDLGGRPAIGVTAVGALEILPSHSGLPDRESRTARSFQHNTMRYSRDVLYRPERRLQHYKVSVLLL